MPLANLVAAIPALTLTTPGGVSVPFHIACHQAASYWLYEEARGMPPPDGDHYTYNQNLININNTMTRFARLGTLLLTANQLTNQPNGTVLIFTDVTGNAAHTCVLDANGNMGGYNQFGWFPGGVGHNFSTHPKTDVQWRNGKQNCVFLNQGQKGRLYAIDEATAVQFARHNF